MKFKIPGSLRGSVKAVFDVIRDPKLLLWSLHLILFPFYIFSSGMPQPSDLVIVLLAPFALRSTRKLIAEAKAPLRTLVAFNIYGLVLNLGWSLVLLKFSFNGKDGFLLSPVFYLFNTLTFLTFIALYQRYGTRFMWLTARLALLSVGIQVTMSFIGRGYAHRATLNFNSPNQLGYFGLLSACMLLIGQRRLKLSTVQVVAGLMACMYLTLMSSSKAALASIAMLGAVIVFNRLRVMLLAGLVLVLALFTANPFSDALDRAQYRIEHDRSAGFAEERGYDRIYNNPEYCVIGSGEGDMRRWADESVLGSHELHSSLGTLIFCYGVVGTLIFGLFSYRVVRRGGFRTWLIVGPAFAYGMSHQGLRFTLFWVFLAMVIALKHLDRIEPLPKRKPGELL